MRATTPDQATSEANINEGWWMLFVSPLIFGAHAVASYLSAVAYCDVASAADEAPGTLPGIILAYTLVALVSLAGMAFWSYRRWQTGRADDNPKATQRVERVRKLGLASFVLTLACVVGTCIVAFLTSFPTFCS